ncbi:MAG: hypothetical protein KDA28_05005, partial [Phycisphaerales bacterium]|nr:hypothetical protein [Phycisphaerales bacterium]
MVLNCTVRNVDGDILEHHTDIFQYFGHFDNLIVFGTEAYDVRKTQNFFLDHNQSSFENCAFVNVVVENTAGSPPKSQLNSHQSHMLFWHISTPRQPWVFRDDFTGEKQFVADTFVMSNCVFEQLSRGDYYAQGVPENVRVENCHFGEGEAHGLNPSTGACYIEEEAAGAASGSSFVYNGPDAIDLRQSGGRLPGLLVPEWIFGGGDHPNRGAYPMHR